MTRNYFQKLRHEQMKKFKIGDWVEFRRYAEFFHNSVERSVVMKETPEPFRGIIAGATFRYTGDIKDEGVPYDDGGYEKGYFQRYLNTRKTNLLWEVKLGLTNKPTLVFTQDLTLLFRWEEKGLQFPPKWKFPDKFGYYDEKMREELRKIIKDVPRTANGKWR
jgi:hypothetical protein